jgi:hypothetical protein
MVPCISGRKSSHPSPRTIVPVNNKHAEGRSKRAITPIPSNAERYEEEPEETGDVAEGMKAGAGPTAPERVGVEEREGDL